MGHNFLFIIFLLKGFGHSMVGSLGGSPGATKGELACGLMKED